MMFSWRSGHFKNFLQWWKGSKRRKSYRKKRAPVVSVPIPHEKIGKVQGSSYRSRESEARMLRILMISIVGVILVVAVVAACIVAYQVKSADGIHWEWLGELMGSQMQSVSQEESSVVSQPEAAEEDSLLVIAREDSPLPEDWEPVLASYGDIQVDERMLADLTAMLAAAQEAGISMQVTCGYVTAQEQEAIYQQKLQGFYSQGYTKVRAEAAAAPYQSGCSEFQTGLSVQLSTTEGKAFEDTEAYAWLAVNGAEYGFVFRYPEGKMSATGVEADLSVLRYVGHEHAVQMRRLEMCLEEYAEYVAQR